MDPSALTPADLARVLTAAGTPTTPEDIQADLAAGAPTSANGTINLIHYIAWLTREVRRGA